jgi:hypothetical protein
MTEVPSTPRRRWIQFSLRGLLAIIALVAVILAWPVREWQLVRHRRIVLDEVRSSFGSIVGPWPGAPSPRLGLRGLFDDVSVSEIALIPETTGAQLARVQAAFPEADVYIATDAGFLGASLRARKSPNPRQIH